MTQLLSKLLFNFLLFLAIAIAILSSTPATSIENNRETASFITLGGMVVVSKSRDITTEIDGRIARLHFLEGQLVKKGDLLVEFDPTLRKLDVEYADARYERAKAALAITQEQLQRNEKLKIKHAISGAKYRESVIKVRMAAANLKIALIDIEKAKLFLGMLKHYAPFDGQMSAPRYRENALVESKKKAEIATIVQLHPIHVKISVLYSSIYNVMKQGKSESERFDKLKLRLELPDGKLLRACR